MPELDDDALLDALGVEVKAPLAREYTREEERIIAGFDEVLRWSEQHGREPQNRPDSDIFERLYAVRLGRLRDLQKSVELLRARDAHGLLAKQDEPVVDLDDDDLLSELGVQGPSEAEDIRTLRHVESYEQRRAAEEVATRTPCEDFSSFESLFRDVESDLRSGVRKTVRLKTRKFEAIQQGAFFIVGGQLSYVAAVSDSFTSGYGRQDRRLRVIFDNGTESDLLQRSFQRGLHRDDLARVVTDPDRGPLFGAPLVAEPAFGDKFGDADRASGFIYVLRSKSDHPFIADHRDLIHKIGVTTKSVRTRIARAERQPTYLLADVEVVARYAVANLDATKLENVIHRLFAPAQIDLTITDRFGFPVRPREWFFVPLPVIDEAVSRIIDGTIVGYEYMKSEARLVPRGA